MSAIDKLKNRKDLQKELDKLGLKVVDAEETTIEPPEFTDEDLADPKKLTAKFASFLTMLDKKHKKDIEDAKSEASKVASETTQEAELRAIRDFLKKHKHTDKEKNKDVLELMDFYYAKGDSVEEAYAKATKSLGLEGGPIGDEDKKKGDENKKKDKTKAAPQNKSSDFKPKDTEEEEEENDTSASGKSKKPLSIRAAAKQALTEVRASIIEEGGDDPLADKGDD